MIRAILFDFGGVIYKHPKEVIPEVLSRIYSYPIADTINAYGKLKNDYFSGKATTKSLINSLSRRFKSNKNIDEVKKLWLKYYGQLAKPDYEVLEIIKALRNLKYRTCLFSNTTEMSNLYNKNTGIYNHFDCLFLSFKIGLCKPNLEFYKVVLSRLSLKPEEIIFIDDDEKNLNPAKLLGINIILFDILKDNPSLLKDKLRLFDIRI